MDDNDLPRDDDDAPPAKPEASSQPAPPWLGLPLQPGSPIHFAPTPFGAVPIGPSGGLFGSPAPAREPAPPPPPPPDLPRGFFGEPLGNPALPFPFGGSPLGMHIGNATGLLGHLLPFSIDSVTASALAAQAQVAPPKEDEPPKS